MRNASAGCPAPVGLFALLVLTAALWPGAVPAHHSFASIYDTGKSVTVTGTVREFQFVHPHPFLVVEVRGKSGERQTWRAEMDNRFELEQIGITGNTFRPGDEVVVSGSPGRSQSSILYMWRLERTADGLLYRQTGGTPSLNKVPIAPGD
ncbi:MAG: hypothetical protein IPH71_07295 [Proteobacteria bacterium]|nr:hypothetical protein [Pseudomonadota bacterium]MCC6631622.1 hypothetical protein [Gammaproteobacteria bacterium]